jgi:hypothetical protein
LASFPELPQQHLPEQLAERAQHDQSVARSVVCTSFGAPRA